MFSVWAHVFLTFKSKDFFWLLVEFVKVYNPVFLRVNFGFLLIKVPQRSITGESKSYERVRVHKSYENRLLGLFQTSFLLTSLIKS